MFSIKKKNLVLIYLLLCTTFLILALNISDIVKDDNLTIMLGLGIIYLAFWIFPWPIRSSPLLFISVTWFIFMKVWFLFHLDPLTGPDSFGYLHQTILFNSLGDFYTYALDHLWTSSYVMFGLVYMPFYYLFGVSSPAFIVVLNSAFILVAIFMWINIIKRQNSKDNTNNKPLFYNLLFFFLLTSASFSYFSSVLLKDITNLFLIVLCLYLLMEKKYLLAILAGVLAYSFRPYAIIIIGCYYLFIKRKIKLSFFILCFAEVYVLYKAGVTGVINSFLNLRYLLLSPNPLDLENWTLLPLPACESLLILLGLVWCAFAFISNKKTRKTLAIAFFVIIIYSCILTLVGQSVILGKGEAYSLFQGGDDFFRKRLPVVFIIYTLFCYVFCSPQEKPSRFSSI